MARSITIAGVDIADDSDCYVIAEIGSNHQGSVDLCKTMISAASAAGAHAVKLQKRDNRTLYTRAFFDAPYNSEHAYGPTYGLHREALEFDRDQYLELMDHAERHSVAFFATAFDAPSADFLADLDVPAFKVASGDLSNLPLLRHLAGFGRPIIMSTGGGTLADIHRAANTIDHHAAPGTELAILHCTAAYPVAWGEMDLRVIETLRREFPDHVIGLSSHDNGIAMGPVAYTLGARIIEKHVTLDRAMKGADNAFSLEPQGLRKLVRDLKRTRLALGHGVKRVYESESAPIAKMSKSLVAARALPAGVTLTPEDIALKSPGGGLSPVSFDALVGVKLTRSMAEDDLFTEDDIAG